MARSVVVSQVLDALLNLPNPAVRLKLAVTSDVPRVTKLWVMEV
jgi:hypothetical protein